MTGLLNAQQLLVYSCVLGTPASSFVPHAMEQWLGKLDGPTSKFELAWPRVFWPASCSYLADFRRHANFHRFIGMNVRPRSPAPLRRQAYATPAARWPRQKASFPLPV